MRTQHLIIEWKITDLGRDPRNIQVALSKDKDNRSFTLSDHEGVFLQLILRVRRNMKTTIKKHVGEKVPFLGKLSTISLITDGEQAIIAQILLLKQKHY